MWAYDGFRGLGSLIANKFEREEWVSNIGGYLQLRYIHMENRFLDTFRYVECCPDNKSSYSYEYSSLLRDAGSVFGSTMNTILQNVRGSGDEFDISHYKEYLCTELENIETIGAEMHIPFKMRLVFPFQQWNEEGKKLKWWEAFSELKHGDFTKFQEGSLDNVVNSMASLAILFSLFSNNARFMINAFEIGYIKRPKPDYIF